MTRLAIVIVNFNAKSDLDVCLTSLHAHPMRTRHEIIIVDNASTDGSLEMLRARWPRLRAIPSPRQRRLRARQQPRDSRNRERADPAAEQRHHRARRRDQSPGRRARSRSRRGHRRPAPGGRAGPHGTLVRPDDGPVQRGPPEAARQADRPPHAGPGGHGLREEAAAGPGTPDWVSGACLLVRRADAEAVGLLDERYFMYTEDIDFCAAIRARGRKVLFVPDVEVVHLRGRSRQTVPAATQAAYRRSHIAFYDKHHPGWAPWLRRYLRWRGQLPEGRVGECALP